MVLEQTIIAVNTSGSAGSGENCFVAGSRSSFIGGVSNNAGSGIGIYSSSGCGVIQGDYCTTLGSSVSTITGDVQYSGIYLSDTSTILGRKTDHSSILASIGSSIATSQGAGSGKGCVVIGSSNSSVGESGNPIAGLHCGIYSCMNSTMNDWSTNNVMIGCTGSSFTNRGNHSCVIAGGARNEFDNDKDSFIGGGIDHEIRVNAQDSAICGGDTNIIDSSQSSFIGGGRDNLIRGSSDRSAIVGGDNCTIEGSVDKSVIAGGTNNLIDGDNLFIGGGFSCDIDNYSQESGIVAGDGNRLLTAGTSFVGGGNVPLNCLILGGNQNEVEDAENSGVSSTSCATEQIILQLLDQ